MEEKDMKQGDKKDLSKRTTQLIALTALILAVCATFSSLKAGGFSSKAILAQNQASDGWAYYQAKSLKENTYKVQIDQMKANPSLDAEQRAALIDKYQQTVERYAAEEKEISEKAKASEASRDRFLTLYGSFAGALTYLQIAILLSSLAALVKQVYFWYISIGVGAIGIYYFVSTLLQV